MVKKLSDTKVSKIFQLYFQGYSQTEIANKLGITQASVSIHISQFKYLAQQQGIMAAAKEYSVMDEVQALYDLAVDLKKAKKTVEEASSGLKMALLFQECGIEEDKYADLIQACKKMDKEDYLFAAVELKQLEDKYGNSYEDIVADYKSSANKIEQTQKKLQDIHGEINSANKALENTIKQKQLANQDLKKYMDQINMDKQKLKLVEPLALVLKEAGIPNQELPEYIKRQQLFDKIGINDALFATIVEKAGVITFKDHGKQLLSLLSEYGSLSDTNKALQLQIESLTKLAADLEHQANLKGKIQIEIAKLKAEKSSLEPQVADLYARKEKLKQVQNNFTYIKNEVNSLKNIKGVLEQTIKQLETSEDGLKKEIGSLEQKVSDLSELEANRDGVLAMLAELEAKRKLEVMEREVFESFLGVIGSSLSAEAIQKFVSGVPQLIVFAKVRKYSPDLLLKVIIKDLSGGTLEIWRCNFCQARFYVDKPAQTFYTGYQCPNCRSSLVEADVTGPEIIKKALTAPPSKVYMVTPLQSPKGTDKKNAGQ